MGLLFDNFLVVLSYKASPILKFGRPTYGILVSLSALKGLPILRSTFCTLPLDEASLTSFTPPKPPSSSSISICPLISRSNFASSYSWRLSSLSSAAPFFSSWGVSYFLLDKSSSKRYNSYSVDRSYLIFHY